MPLTTPQPRLSGQSRSSSIQSALAKAPDLRRTMRGSVGQTTDWQRKVIDYDRDGPGVLGYYLDTVELLASLCPLVPAIQQRNGEWVRAEDPVLSVLAAGYKSALFEQHELVGHHVRHREGVGEAWIVWSKDVGWCIITVPNVAIQGDAIRWTDPFGRQRITPEDQVYKSWIPDKYQPWLTSSPVRRALPNLRRVHSAVRNQTRAADSRLTVNGLLAFSPDDGTSGPLASMPPPEAGDDARPEGVQGVIADYIEFAGRAFDDDDSVAAHVPFPFIGQAPDTVDLGRGVDENAMKMEDKGIEAFARDVNFPAQLLVEGPGAANHWNEWILQEVQQKMGLAPKLNPVAADITAVYFRPAVRQLKGRVGSWDVDPARVRLQPDYTFLTSKPDLAAKAIEAYRTGAISRAEMTEALGFAEPLDVPDGLSEYEHWQIAVGRPGAPFIEVDGDNRVIVPPDPFAQGGEGEGEAVEGGEDPAAEDALGGVDDEPLPEATEPTVIPIATPDDGGRQPPEPPAVAALTAAVEDDEETRQTEALLAALAAIDAGLVAGLSGAADAAVTAAAAEVAKAVIRAYPPRHPDRARLRELPAVEVWAEADPEIRETVDVDAIASEALAPYQDQFEDLYGDAAEAIVAAHERANSSVIPEILVTIAALVLARGLARLLTSWARVPTRLTAEGVVRGVGRRSLRVPLGVIRTSMAAAGGAVVDVAGNAAPGASGTPTPGDGGRWEGAPGTALGNNSIESVRLPPGTRLSLKWQHGLYRTPKEPFAPHVALDGSTFDSLADVPGGFFPGDHPWCSCGMIPSLGRT